MAPLPTTMAELVHRIQDAYDDIPQATVSRAIRYFLLLYLICIYIPYLIHALICATVATLSFSVSFSCCCCCYHLLVQAPDAPEGHEAGGEDGSPRGGEGEGAGPLVFCNISLGTRFR